MKAPLLTTMSLRGQRFELDLDADDFTPRPYSEDESLTSPSLIGDIRERDSNVVPSAPAVKATKSGFPEHRRRGKVSTFKQQRSAQHEGDQVSTSRITLDGHTDASPQAGTKKTSGSWKTAQPPDGNSFSVERQQISKDNDLRLAQMTESEIAEAREELFSTINPRFLEQFLRRANIDDNHTEEHSSMISSPVVSQPSHAKVTDETEHDILDQSGIDVQDNNEGNDPRPPPPSEDHHPIHFPVPPRSAADYASLDPSSPAFLSQLKDHYFPNTPHDPESLAWLQAPTEDEQQDSSYNPDRTAFPASDLRFSFRGALIAPNDSLAIPVSDGLHHHGDAPSSAGYTILELAILARSVLPNQRSAAYQITGRILYRLGRGDFGPRGTEMCEGLWHVIERERIVEVMMAEANRDTGHVSAKAHAVDALWLWRKGGGGDCGILREGERRAT